jgi:antitoxin CcdA
VLPGRGLFMNYKRKPTVALSIDRDLVSAVEAAGLDPQQAAELGLVRALGVQRSGEWLAENRPALESSNSFVEEQGLPLARHRLF